MTFLDAVSRPPEVVGDVHEGSDADAGPASDRQLLVVRVCAAVATVIALFSGVEPTGTTWWDPVLIIGLTALFVFASARASRVAVMAAAGLAATFCGLSLWLGVAAIGFVVAAASARTPDRTVEAFAASGACTIVALFHLQTFVIFGFSAAVAATAIFIVLASAYRRSTKDLQQQTRSAAIVVALVLGLVLVVSLYMALSIRTTANAGVRSARQGLSAARAGDTQELRTQLERAQQQFGQANDQLGSIWLQPLKLVPVAAQNLRSVSIATEQGLIVANEAAATASDADLDKLQLRQGQFDLDVLAAMAPQLDRTSTQLENSIRQIEATRTLWLLPPVASQLDILVAEITTVLPEAQLAADAARVMPGLLGADGERRYLMLFGSPGESREFGGFVGGFALISVSDGNLDLVEAGSINDLVPIAREDSLEDPASYPVEFVEADPAFYPQNLTSTPNIYVIARAARDIFPTLLGAPLDGVIYADPFALAAMTEFTGPISVEGIDEPLDSAGLINFIFEGQYEFFDDRRERFTAIGALAAATAAAFENADLPGPERLGEVLGPVARAGRLQIVTYDPDENAFLASVKLQRDFVAPEGVDAFALVQTNGTASKLDLYLHREIEFTINVDADGSLTAIVDVEVRSEIADDVPPLTYGETDGTNQVLLSLYSRHELVDLTVDGQPHEYVIQEEFGLFRYALFKVPLAPNESRDISFVLTGTAPGEPYRAGIWEQPLANLDTVRVTYQGGSEASISSERVLGESWLFDPAQIAAGGSE